MRKRDNEKGRETDSKCVREVVEERDNQVRTSNGETQ